MIIAGLVHMVITLGLIIWAYITGKPEPLPHYPRHALWTKDEPLQRIFSPFAESKPKPAWSALIDLGMAGHDDHRLPGDK